MLRCVLLFLTAAQAIEHPTILFPDSRYDRNETLAIIPGYYMLQSDLRMISYPPSVARYTTTGAVTGCCVGTAAGGLTCGAACPLFPQFLGLHVGLSLAAFFLEKNKLQMGVDRIVVWKIEADESEANAFTLQAVAPKACEGVERFQKAYTKPMVAHRSTFMNDWIYLRTTGDENGEISWLHAGSRYAEMSMTDKSPWTLLRLDDDEFL